MRFVLALVLLLAACGDNLHGALDAVGTGTDAVGTGTDGSGGGGDGSGGPATINLTLTNRPNDAAMFTFVVAYQDGSGPWTLAPAPTGDTYSFPVSAPVYGVAWTCVAPGGGGGGPGGVELRAVNEAHFAVAERTSLTQDVPGRCTDRAPMTVALTGTVSNRGGGGLYLVAFGGGITFVNPQNGTYTLRIPPSTHDLFLLHAVGNGFGNFAIDRATVQRGVAANAATTRNLDASTLLATRKFTVTIVAPGAARTTAATTLYTANGSSARLVQQGAMPFESDALASTLTAAGDVYDQSITVSGQGQTAIVTNATAAPAAQTYVAPTPLGGATSTVPSTTPYPQLATTWAAYSNAVGYTWAATQQPTRAQCGGAPCSVTWTTLLSPGVAGTAPSFQMGDLSALAGWSASLQFLAGTMVAGTVEAMTSTAGDADFPAGTPAAGTQRVFVRSGFTVTP
jgi:hypothetical protein